METIDDASKGPDVSSDKIVDTDRNAYCAKSAVQTWAFVEIEK